MKSANNFNSLGIVVESMVFLRITHKIPCKGCHSESQKKSRHILPKRRVSRPANSGYPAVNSNEELLYKDLRSASEGLRKPKYH